MDSLLREAVERVLADLCTFEAVQRAEVDGWSPSLWSAFADMGLPWVSVAEAAGGSGGSLTDALGIVRLTGRFAAPIPQAETGVLAGWLLAEAGLPLPPGPATVAPGRPEDTLTLRAGVLQGTAHRVPWARVCDRVVALVHGDSSDATEAWSVASVPVSSVRIVPVTNLAGEPRDSVVFDGVEADIAPAPPGIAPPSLELRGALVRAAAIAGALERLSELTTDYANDRRQFGKPIARFQAVQAHLVHLAEHAVMVGVAVDAAVRAAERGAGQFEIAAAKVLASEGAGRAAAHAHQVHGAIGMTQEYRLHHLTRRLWSWRDEFGGERSWSMRLGGALEAAGPERLYPTIAAGSAVLPAL